MLLVRQVVNWATERSDEIEELIETSIQTILYPPSGKIPKKGFLELV